MTATADPAGIAASTVLAERIRALDDFGRRSVLMWLAGYAPEAVRVALDEIDSQLAEAERSSAS